MIQYGSDWTNVPTSGPAQSKTSDVYRSVAQFILQFKPGKAVEMYRVIKGGDNVAYRPEYNDGTSVIMRIPINGTSARCLYPSTCCKYISLLILFPSFRSRRRASSVSRRKGPMRGRYYAIPSGNHKHFRATRLPLWYGG